MKNKKSKYLNPVLPVEIRIKDLLGRMTLEEKVKQLHAVHSPDKILENGKFSLKKVKKILDKGMGQLSTIFRPLGPKEGAELANEIQKFAVENTRLGIPIIIHDECIHGCMAKGSTSFSQSIALASTWNPGLIEKIAAVIGKETRARGIHYALSPTINITRDPRCGRTEETYGEDPYLTSCMGVAFVRGIQSQKVIATIKHFAANFVGDGGRDSHAVHFSELILREIYFPAFEACVREAGALSLMASYNSIDGMPSSCNKWLLTDVLRKEWKFKGFVVSDYWSVKQILELHNTAETKAEAAKKAIEAGLDIELPAADCFEELMQLVKKGKLSKKVIDESVRRVLRAKFWLGLFENPYVNTDYAAEICDCNEHRKLALESARESIVLLKNINETLPLDKNLKSVAVIGLQSK
jgi:beta-glucosidase